MMEMDGGPPWPFMNIIYCAKGLSSIQICSTNYSHSAQAKTSVLPLLALAKSTPMTKGHNFHHKPHSHKPHPHPHKSINTASPHPLPAPNSSPKASLQSCKSPFPLPTHLGSTLYAVPGVKASIYHPTPPNGPTSPAPTPSVSNQLRNPLPSQTPSLPNCSTRAAAS